MNSNFTVFYSWQSDILAKFNRTFIEEALKAALTKLSADATLIPALRDSELSLDKDTQGVAGSPPIADTILQKIEDCSVFVADLTFVGETSRDIVGRKRRFFPNPNVLIEYGYALRCHGHERLIGIVNIAFGESHSDNLPFDLRHLRWPITYDLERGGRSAARGPTGRLNTATGRGYKARLNCQGPVANRNARFRCSDIDQRSFGFFRQSY
jgi:hypothetical protein